jgi:hypothetical protein
MSEIIKICDRCHLEKDLAAGNGTVNLIYNEIEPGNCAAVTQTEFDALAMHSLLVKRMVEYIMCDYVGYSVDYPRACMRDNLLTDIAALTESHAEEKK